MSQRIRRKGRRWWDLDACQICGSTEVVNEFLGRIKCPHCFGPFEACRTPITRGPNARFNPFCRDCRRIWAEDRGRL